VQRLLELARSKGSGAPFFIQISTDEVYGDILSGCHHELSPLKPSNPYAATKAAADMLILGWARTYGVQYNIIRMTNNYGPNQYPEKLIPKSAWRMRRGLPALMHGDGSYFRSWLHVEDAVDAILTVMAKGDPNQVYNVHGENELRNIEVLKKIAELLAIPESDAFVKIPNRVGQDIRYSLDDTKVRNLGWQPVRVFEEELKKIIENDNFKRFQ
jgi:dTDP-glucose 4,6-dehydratase